METARYIGMRDNRIFLLLAIGLTVLACDSGGDDDGGSGGAGAASGGGAMDGGGGCASGVPYTEECGCSSYTYYFTCECECGDKTHYENIYTAPESAEACEALEGTECPLGGGGHPPLSACVSLGQGFPCGP